MILHGDLLAGLEPREPLPDLLGLVQIVLLLLEKVLPHLHDVSLVLVVGGLGLEVLLHLGIDVKMFLDQSALLLGGVDVIKKDDLLGRHGSRRRIITRRRFL